MGGNMDATNIIKNTRLAVLVSVSMDHMSFLGNTLGEIAEKKAESSSRAVRWLPQNSKKKQNR